MRRRWPRAAIRIRTRIHVEHSSIAYGKELVDILVAVLPCAWVYADYGQRLAREFADTLDANPYKSWVDMYKTEEFWEGSAWLIEHIERLAEGLSEKRKRELIDIFVTGVETSTCSGPAPTTCSTRGSPNGIGGADAAAVQGPLTFDCLFSLQRWVASIPGCNPPLSSREFPSRGSPSGEVAYSRTSRICSTSSRWERR